MADALSTIHVIAEDPDFRGRLNAAAAQQSAPGDPVVWAWNHRYEIAAAPTWAEKVDYWLLQNPDADPPNGWALDVAVISDGDIVARVQQMLAAEGPDPEVSNG